MLQHKEIPPRPAQYDGVVRLGGLPRHVDEAALRAALGTFGEVVSCEMDVGGGGEAVVCFASQGGAGLAPLLLERRHPPRTLCCAFG